MRTGKLPLLVEQPRKAALILEANVPGHFQGSLGVKNAISAPTPAIFGELAISFESVAGSRFRPSKSARIKQSGGNALSFLAFWPAKTKPDVARAGF